MSLAKGQQVAELGFKLSSSRALLLHGSGLEWG